MRNMVPVVAFFLSAVLAGCSREGGGTDAASDSHHPSYDEALDQARNSLAGTTYEDQHGFEGCTDDCSGHNAGYQWAQENGVEDASGCYGNSNSFEEGCAAYANDLQAVAQHLRGASAN